MPRMLIGCFLGSRPMAGRQTLDLLIGVRILSPQSSGVPERSKIFWGAHLVPSSRGLGRGPLKAKTRVRIPLGPPARLSDPRSLSVSSLSHHRTRGCAHRERSSSEEKCLSRNEREHERKEQSIRGSAQVLFPEGQRDRGVLQRSSLNKTIVLYLASFTKKHYLLFHTDRSQ